MKNEDEQRRDEDEKGRKIFSVDLLESDHECSGKYYGNE
jgi:hypothetical protein